MKELAAYTRSLDCVHCGLCLPTCPTYDVLGLETDSPRGRIYLMRALAEGRIDDPASIRPYLDRCLDCRACETACPSGVRYGEILETVRGELEQQSPSRGTGSRLRRALLRRIVPHSRRRRTVFAALRAAQVLRLDRVAAACGLLPKAVADLAPVIPPAKQRRPIHGSYQPRGPVRGRVALFTGCVMEQLFGDINRATRDLLLANGFAVDIPVAQGCCGALLIHNGQQREARALAEQNHRAFESADVVIHNSAGCGAAMKEYGELLGSDAGAALAAKSRDICEFLATAGLTAEPAPLRQKVAYDDPCHLCHGQGVRQQPRDLLRQVPGLELVNHRDPETCCGSAGIYNLVHPDLATEIGANKARALTESDAAIVVTGNPGCMMQIRAHLRGQRDLEVRHPVELLLPPT